MKVHFSKYSGLGNDFIFIEDKEESFPIQPLLLQRLCHRHEGIGADGVVLVQPSSKADCRMRIFNSDGTEAEMCGNALRCLYLFMLELGFSKETFVVETLKRMHQIKKCGDEICCEMGEISSIEWDIELSFNQIDLKGHFVNTGVPHFVIPTKNLHQLPILPLGQFVRRHSRFQPEGTNVNFMNLDSNQVIQLRTYERGVEAETQACGTGAAAAALIGSQLYNLEQPIEVKMQQGKKLKFTFDLKEGHVHNLAMFGPATFVFSGSFDLFNMSSESLLSHHVRFSSTT